MTRTTKEETREQILKAALEVFGEYGYAASTLPQLAKAAGVAVGTIYVHFSDKQELVNELYRHWKKELFYSLDLGKSNDPPRDRFHRFWKSYIGFGLEHQQAMVFLENHHHATYLDETSRELAERVIGSYLTFVNEMVSANVFKPFHSVLLLAALHGISTSVLEKVWHGHIEPTEETMKQAEQLCWEAVRA